MGQVERRQQKADWQAKWRAENPEKAVGYSRQYKRTADGRRKIRDHQLRTRYGITLVQYEERFASQGGRCAICGTSDPGRGNTHFCVDHCHASGIVRGLLCNPCNTAIGLMQDEATRLECAAAYLREWTK